MTDKNRKFSERNNLTIKAKKLMENDDVDSQTYEPINDSSSANLTPSSGKKINKRKKDEKYKIQIDNMLRFIYEVLNLKKDLMNSKGDFFYIDDISHDTKQKIIEKKDLCKLYFYTKNWAVFKESNDNDNEWLSIVKNVFKNCGYEVTILTYERNKVIKKMIFVKKK
jgi:hypothetical protein